VLIILVLARLMGATTGVALRTGLYPGAGGRVRLCAAVAHAGNGLVQPALMNPILAAMVLSMLATPFIIMYSNRIVMKLVASDWLQQSLQMTTIARKSINTSKHVIICGYGRCGQNLARMLEREGIPYMALDLDPDRVRQAAAAGDSVVYGDATRLQALMAAGLVRASAVVVTYIDVPAPSRCWPTPAPTRRRCRWWCAPRTTPPGQAAGRRRHRGGARGHRRLADAGQPRAGAGGRAHAPGAARGAGPARCALQPAARLLPWRRRRHRRTSATRSACPPSPCHWAPRSSGQAAGWAGLHAMGVRVVTKVFGC
jgi:hypothetical protein